MASEPVHTWHPDMITLRQAEALTGTNYQTIHDAAIAGHIKWGRYYPPPTFRVNQADVLAWATQQGAA